MIIVLFFMLQFCSHVIFVFSVKTDYGITESQSTISRELETTTTNLAFDSDANASIPQGTAIISTHLIYN